MFPEHVGSRDLLNGGILGNGGAGDGSVTLSVFIVQLVFLATRCCMNCAAFGLCVSLSGQKLWTQRQMSCPRVPSFRLNCSSSKCPQSVREPADALWASVVSRAKNHRPIFKQAKKWR